MSAPGDRQPAPAIKAHHGRLQRGPDASGYRVATFCDVVKRHGVTMGCLAAICLLVPGAFPAIANTMAPLFQQLAAYLVGLVGLLVFFACWTTRRAGAPGRKAQWVLYLLYISIVEELTFRLILPGILAGTCNWLAAIVMSNLLFAGIHYFTLRWKLRNCIATFVGGMGLSQLMSGGDLALVVMVHWCGTFLNTPFPPPVRKQQ